MAEPRVSVIIAVHNGERYLAAAIESALDQRHPPFDVVVVDDGSSDASLAIAQQFGPPVRCVSQDRRGAGAARNVGCATCRGEFVAYLDADDLLTRNALACQLAAFAADPSLDLVFGHVRQFISPDLDAATASRLVCPPGLQPGYLIGAVLVRRAAFDRVGGFREDVGSGEFVDWMARARELRLREAMLDEHVLTRRLHATNHGRLHMNERADYARVLRSALDRRRAGSKA